jgi:site-specific DNA-methyltransferase (adenine-specific)
VSDWIVHTCDCLEFLKTLPSGSVDAVVTDPPYGTGAWIRPDPGAGRDCRAIHSQEEWDVWDVRWMDEAVRIASGRIGLFCAQVNLRSVFAWAKDRPWRLCVWTKTDPRPRFGGQPAFAFECFVSIGGVENCGGTDVVTASSPRENRDADGTGHPHQKPIEAATWAVDLVAQPGGAVLDPFCGSGTTGVACMMTGRNFIGIEIDPHYADIARRRIGEAASTLWTPPKPRVPDPELFQEGNRA